MQIEVYNQKAEQVSKADLPVDIFGVEINPGLVHQAAVSQMANSRKVIAHAKDRSEVRGGGRKPWRQKGTGRARHGSIRSPIWRGGGAAFGPTKERNFSKKINTKMKRQALFMVLSSKIKDQEMILLDSFEISEPKTKKVKEILDNFNNKLKKDLTKGSLIVLEDKNEKIMRASSNLPKIRTIRADSLNVLDLLNCKYLLMTEPAIKVIEKTYKTNNKLKSK